MQPPQLSDYQAAATAIYQPQEQVEQQQIQSTDQTTKNSLNAEQGQVQTDYQSAIDQLTNSVQDQTAKINQLYTENLGGNFSGLQGNDLGQMYSRANQSQSIIEQTRANKLSEITAAETNADITMNSDLAALAPKYQSLETQYAQSAYSSAVNNYNTTQYHNAELGLEQERVDLEANKDNTNNITGYKAKQGSEGQYMFTGPNGQPLDMSQYLSAITSNLSGSSKGQAWTEQALNLLKNGTSYDKAIYQKALAAQQSGGDVAATIKKYDTKNAYGI